MSNKKSSESVVQGRRLRPIYDAIDSGQNKKAIQEADKVLKKHPETLAAKALKALALIRAERSAEAWTIVGDVEDGMKTGNYDENLVQAVCHCYKEGFMPERIVALYEMLTKKFPGDEAMLSQLFLAYVRVRNYREQQKVAMQLYKEFNLPPYFMWSIMSIVMQGLENEKMGSSMFYPLAEKMLVKISESYELKGEEIDLYLHVLEARGKLKETIDLLNKDHLYSQENAVAGTKAYHALDRLYFLAKNYDVVVERAIKNIENDYNDWTSWVQFLDSQFEISNNLAAQTSKCSDAVAKQLSGITRICLQAIEKSQDVPEVVLRRGPILACLEVHDRLRKHEYLPNAELEKELKLDSVLSYMKQIVDCSHTKPYCFSDIKLYLHLLDEKAEKQLVAYIDELIYSGEELENASNYLWTNVLKEKILLTQAYQKKKKNFQRRS